MYSTYTIVDYSNGPEYNGIEETEKCKLINTNSVNLVWRKRNDLSSYIIEEIPPPVFRHNLFLSFKY